MRLPGAGRRPPCPGCNADETPESFRGGPHTRVRCEWELPPGVYRVTLREIEERLTWNTRRRRLFRGLRLALANLASAGVRRVWIDGSFVTARDEPNDIDGCWDPHPSVDADKLDPVFRDARAPRQSMKAKYGVDFLIAGTALVDAGGERVEDFFQEDGHGNPKGILLVKIGTHS